LGEGLKTSATYIVIIHYQNFLQARLEPDLAMNVQLQRGTVFSSQLYQHPPKSFAVTLRLTFLWKWNDKLLHTTDPFTSPGKKM